VGSANVYGSFWGLTNEHCPRRGRPCRLSRLVNDMYGKSGKQMIRKTGLAALILLLHLAQTATAQDPKEKAAPERSNIISVAKEVMREARYCTFVTIGSGGHPQARVMDPFDPEEDLTVWVATNSVTRKVAELRKDPRVTLFYLEPESLSYVTLLGKAEIVQDPAEKAKHWKEEWAPFYKDGSRGDDYLLIRVRPSRLEIVSYSHGLLNDPETWAPPALDLP